MHDEPDRLFIGAFDNPNLRPEQLENAAKTFVKCYAAAGKTSCVYSPDVLGDRWKKLVYNACLNPICGIVGVDSGRVRLADGALDGLVRYVFAWIWRCVCGWVVVDAMQACDAGNRSRGGSERGCAAR